MDIKFLNTFFARMILRSIDFDIYHANEVCHGFCSLTVMLSSKGPDALHVLGLPDRVSSGAPFVLSRSDGGRLTVSCSS